MRPDRLTKAESIGVMTSALLAGILGAAVALIYHLSHLDSLQHTVRHYGERRTTQREHQSLRR